MKLNYRLMVTGLSSMTISLIVSIFLTFHVRQNTIVQFINNIFLNVFAGALILFVTSMVEYFVSKRRNFEEIMNYILKYRSYFSKIKYLNEIKYLTYDEYKTNFKKNGKSNEGFIKLIKEYDEYIQNQFKDIDEIIDAYLDIANINLNDFLAIYDDLRFVINNAYKKSKLNNEIFKKISDEVNNIRRLSYIIKTYNTEGSNPIVTYEEIRKYQKNIFYEKIYSKGKKIDDKNMKLIRSGISCSISNNGDNSLFIYNKFILYLDNKFEEIRKMAYFYRNHKS